MRTFKDDRNRAYNDVFPAIGCGDINVSILYPGTIKAFHRHQRQDDYWFVARGQLRVVLGYPETEVPRVHYLGEGDLLHIPRGVWHGLQVLGTDDAIMVYHITNKYSDTNPDEERAPWDAFYSWDISRK